MSTRIYWIHEFSNATKIGIMARPRGNEWLEDEISSFKKQKVDIVISLLEKEEITELGLGQEEALCNKYGIKFRSFPIKDRALPNSKTKTEDFVQSIFGEIMAGLNVVVHCRMGIGRSSIIAGAIILLAGSTADNIISRVTKVRGLRVPDTDEQLEWLRQQQKT